MTGRIHPGLYEQIVSLFMANVLDESTSKQVALDPADSNAYLAQYISKVLQRGLAELKGDDKLEKQVAVCNEIIRTLGDAGVSNIHNQAVSPEARRLLAVMHSAAENAPVRPDTPLNFGALLTGTRLDPSLASQIQKELATADACDLLVSFIKWSGINNLRAALASFANRGGRLRIITTSYIGATELEAITFLATLPNATVKVSYDTHRTRLHAKAYLFHRSSGFSSAYIGSSNMTNAALSDGLEWNVKLSEYEQPYQWEKVTGTFETYWHDAEFESFDPETDAERFTNALKSEKRGGTVILPQFDLRPFAFQEEILDRIDAERILGKHSRHLIVAATGTGKTMIAAFDFKRWRTSFVKDTGRQPRFAFVAHRKEILEQALATFRAVLRDQNFGDVMVDGAVPSQHDTLFISIQTYNSRSMQDTFPPDHFDYIVVDEFHHAPAASYQRLLEHVMPQTLLGLTATPERMDGMDVRAYFDDHITAEIRLPDAINRKLLSPFHYFGITDSVDYAGISWQRGGYHVNELSNLLTGNDVRTRLVIDKTVETVRNVHECRGIGFCVSRQHAEYMAAQFTKAGITATFLTADSPRDHRASVKHDLEAGNINFVFVVDLYNEGVDIPAVDTVLFLRPTESLTIFLQQLGRGLRLDDDKDCLTVLDFVGHAHAKFRYDLRFRALMSRGADVKDEVESGFPSLPAGCSINLERKAQEYVLENIKQSLLMNKPQIIRNIASFENDTGRTLSLAKFLEYYRLETDDIYRKASWSRLCAEAGVRDGFADPDEERLSKGLRRIQHIDDAGQIAFVSRLLTMDDAEISALDGESTRRAMMAFVSLWGRDALPKSVSDGMALLRKNPVMMDELLELLMLRSEAVKSVPPKVSLPFETPLAVHGQYTRDEILMGLGYWTAKKQPEVREGVREMKHIKADVFFITLNKTEKHYSPTTMYHDYAINERLFHWQSQSTTPEDSPTGRRYINHKKMGYTVLLFVREQKSRNNLAEPYHFLGPADYVSHTGSRPMNITWQLRHPMPAHLVRETVRMRVG